MELSKTAGLLAFTLFLAACSQDGFSRDRNSPYAPQVDRRAEAVDQLLVGHRLLASKEYELALTAFNRAALERGLDDAEVLSALGTANLALGRLGQSETLLRRAVKKEENWPEVWNNLGVVLMERGKTAEASQVFHRAYAIDNGQSDAIRDNLRLALAKLDDVQYDTEQQQEYKLVRRGSSDYLIRTAQ
ncbi:MULTISPECIES: tetratricopeptide repeat protein [unclassified Marinovum]